MPGFGLPAKDFPEPAFYLWNSAKDFASPAMYGSGPKVPLKPFCGTIGVAPAEAGEFCTIPHYAQGGNMDIRDLNIGVALYLPVKVMGALYSIGDTHAAQGDGEICGTAIESPISVSVNFDLVKEKKSQFSQVYYEWSG